MRQSGHGIGVLGQLHLYLDDMFPQTIGQPLHRQVLPLRKNSTSEVMSCEHSSLFCRSSALALGSSRGAGARLPRPCEPAGRLDGTVRSARGDLTFTQNLEPAFSTVAVTDGNGARVDQGKPSISGNTMRIGLKACGSGSYKVRWHALSVDTHTTQGSFTFHVGNP